MVGEGEELREDIKLVKIQCLDMAGQSMEMSNYQGVMPIINQQKIHEPPSAVKTGHEEHECI